MAGLEYSHSIALDSFVQLDLLCIWSCARTFHGLFRREGGASVRDVGENSKAQGQPLLQSRLNNIYGRWLGHLTEGVAGLSNDPNRRRGGPDGATSGSPKTATIPDASESGKRDLQHIGCMECEFWQEQ